MSVKMTIITPTYNVGDKIVATINSVIIQSMTDYEYIIMDGKSNDDIRVRIEKYLEKYPQIQFYQETDTGIYDAMNKAVQIAKGEYCYFIGAGDTLHDSEVLANVINTAEDTNADIIYGYVNAVGEENEYALNYRLDYRYAIQFFPVCHQAVFGKTKLLKQRGFDLTYRVGADQDWMMYMKKQKKNFVYINYPIANYMLDGYSNSEVGKNIFDEEKVKIHKKYFPINYYLITNYRRIRDFVKGIFCKGKGE